MTPYELEERADGSVSERKSYVPVVASVSSALMFGAVAFWGLGGGATSGGPPSSPLGTIGKPNTPVILTVTPVVDSVTLEITTDDFTGSQGDTQDSLHVLVDTAGGGFGPPFIDSLSGAVGTDTVSYPFASGGVYDFVALKKGISGGWSDTSDVFQHTISFVPDAPVLWVDEVGPDSVVIKFLATTDGEGGISNYDLRRDITPPMQWWTQDSTTQVDSSRSVAVGDTVTMVSPGLPSSTNVDFQAVAYRGVLSVDVEEFSDLSNIVSATTESSGGFTAPTLTVFSFSDSSTANATSSIYGGGESHDSTHWQVCRYSTNCSAALVDSTSGVNLTSITIASNANFKGDSVYSARVRYKESVSGWSAWSDTSTATAPGPSPPVGVEPLFNAAEDVTYHYDGFEDFSSTADVLTHGSVFSYAYVESAGTSTSNTELRTSGARSGSQSWRNLWDTSGNQQNRTIATLCCTGSPPSSVDEVIATFWLKVTADYEWWNATGNTHKIFEMKMFNNLRVLFSSGNGSVTGEWEDEYNSVGGNRPHFSVKTTTPGSARKYRQNMNYDRVRLSGSSGSDVNVSDGGWHRFTIRVTRSTNGGPYDAATGVGDGRLELWIDGIKVIEFIGDDPGRFEYQDVGVPNNNTSSRIVATIGFPTQRNADTSGQSLWMEFDDVRLWRDVN